MLTWNLTPKSPKFRAHRSLLIAVSTPLPHSLDYLVNSWVNRWEESRAGYCPGYVDGNRANYRDNCSADYRHDNRPENGDGSLGNCWDSSSPRHPDDSPENHRADSWENDREENRADNLPNYSADCQVNRLPDYPENYGPNGTQRPVVKSVPPRI
jgi:hypothetical protein